MMTSGNGTRQRSPGGRARKSLFSTLLLAMGLCVLAHGAMPAGPATAPAADAAAPPAAASTAATPPAPPAKIVIGRYIPPATAPAATPPAPPAKIVIGRYIPPATAPAATPPAPAAKIVIGRYIPPATAPATAASAEAATTASLSQTRMLLGSWIDTQHTIAKERKDWQQGKDMLTARIDLVKKEISTLEDKVADSQKNVTDTSGKRAELTAQVDELKAINVMLTQVVTALEGDIRRLHKALPEYVQEKIKPLYTRIPDDAATTKVTAAERFQNVLVILNALNDANNDIKVNYEVHKLASGKSTEVKAIYIGLAQAYYVSATGEAGIGRPTLNGWEWEPSKAVSRGVIEALEIIQGKQAAAFLPFPVKIQ